MAKKVKERAVDWGVIIDATGNPSAITANKLKGILEYTAEPLVSADIITDPNSSIFDSELTNVIGGNFVKVIAWYDNEWGFSERMIDVIKLIGR